MSSVMTLKHIREVARCTGLAITHMGGDVYKVNDIDKGNYFFAKNIHELEHKVMALNTVLCIRWEGK